MWNPSVCLLVTTLVRPRSVVPRGSLSTQMRSSSSRTRVKGLPVCDAARDSSCGHAASKSSRKWRISCPDKGRTASPTESWDKPPRSTCALRRPSSGSMLAGTLWEDLRCYCQFGMFDVIELLEHADDGAPGDSFLWITEA